MLPTAAPDGARRETRLRRFALRAALLGRSRRQDDGTHGASIRRRRVLAVITATAVAAAGLGWWAGRVIQSPDELARTASPPKASVVTAAVERRELSTDVVVRGDVVLAQSVDIEIDPDLGVEAAAGAASQLVVTGRVPEVGSELRAGSVALEVSGRPIFLLPGALPMYRGLRPGSRGPDVRQLEQALEQLGFGPGTVDDAYDANTAAAVTRWYRAAGYEPVGASQDERDRLAAAEDRVKAARAAVLQAEAALDEARRPPPRSAVLAAEGAVAAARAALDQAIADRDRALAQAGPGEREAVQREHDALVAQARNALAVAEAQLAELVAARDTRAQERMLADARASRDAVERELGSLRAAIGIRIPRGEVVFLSGLPRRLNKVMVARGSRPNGPVLTLAASGLQIDAALAAEDHTLVKVGARAQIDEPSLGIDVPATVTMVAETRSTNGAPPGHYYLRLVPTGEVRNLIGVNVRVTIPIRSTNGAVLTVPVAALTTDAAGTVRVRVLRGPDGFSDVTVTPGLAADGFVEVTPVDGALAGGDEVMVGQR